MGLVETPGPTGEPEPTPNDDSILKIANGYAKEIFDLVDEDSLDSVCEFINCINGLFATQLSHENVNIDMLPPDLRINGFTVTA